MPDDQLNFPDSTMTGRDHPQTSFDAAGRALPKSGTQRRAVYQYIVWSGWHGVSDDDLAEGLSLSPNSVRPRRKELQQAGLIVDSGRRARNRGGNPVILWVTADLGSPR